MNVRHILTIYEDGDLTFGTRGGGVWELFLGPRPGGGRAFPFNQLDRAGEMGGVIPGGSLTFKKKKTIRKIVLSYC